MNKLTAPQLTSLLGAHFALMGSSFTVGQAIGALDLLASTLGDLEALCNQVPSNSPTTVTSPPITAAPVVSDPTAVAPVAPTIGAKT